MKKEALFSLLFLLLLRGGIGGDFETFCELVSLSPEKSEWCTDCMHPCDREECDVTCKDDGTGTTRITGINAAGRDLTALPYSIGNLTLLTSVL